MKEKFAIDYKIKQLSTVFYIPKHIYNINAFLGLLQCRLYGRLCYDL